MLRGANSKRQRKPGRVRPRREVRFPGLISDAEALGVHRNHLYLVLCGKRVSHNLLNRYQELQELKAAQK